MKHLTISKVMFAAAVVLLAACGTKKQTTKVDTTSSPAVLEHTRFLQKVSDNAQYKKFITSKVKFRIQRGPQDMTLTGNLKMKKDDVIRLQLMAFGFVEAGRLEFTKDYVLIVDRINKQYIKASYNQLEFLRNTGINFYSLQALFWNELFMPGASKVSDETYKSYTSDVTKDQVVISYERDKMSYKWLADKGDGLIQMANIMYKDKVHGKSQLNWDYSDFIAVSHRQFPKKNTVKFSADSTKDVNMTLTLNYIEHDSEWETRTELSDAYTQVSVSEILRRFMAL